METRPAHKRVWRSRRSGSSAQRSAAELLLKADGRFEYMLAYGALDELASGCWTRNGRVVTVNAQKLLTTPMTR